MKQLSLGKSYDEAIAELIKFRESQSKSEVTLYEEFCYMDDEDWFSIVDEIKPKNY
ncbi:TPA: hypothetical protein ACGOYX_001719 [Streptococcus suis]